jgi:hypothetical protein
MCFAGRRVKKPSPTLKEKRMKVWKMSGFAGSGDLMERADGDWVKYSDYLILKEALKEALDLADRDYQIRMDIVKERIQELRKQFLRD